MTSYTTEMRAADADIARAMGVDNQPKVPPRFHESEDARRSLLEWLAADDARWKRFVDRMDVEHEPPYTLARLLMLATPAQVAEAAHRVIVEGKKNDR